MGLEDKVGRCGIAIISDEVQIIARDQGKIIAAIASDYAVTDSVAAIKRDLICAAHGISLECDVIG